MESPVAQAAKEHIASGGEPRCVMDFWAKEIAQNPRGFEVDNADMASTVLDFLFASQDATTSAVSQNIYIIWFIYFLC